MQAAPRSRAQPHLQQEGAQLQQLALRQRLQRVVHRRLVQGRGVLARHGQHHARRREEGLQRQQQRPGAQQPGVAQHAQHGGHVLQGAVAEGRVRRGGRAVAAVGALLLRREHALQQAVHARLRAARAGRHARARGAGVSVPGVGGAARRTSRARAREAGRTR